MPKTHVDRSIFIERNPEEVFKVVSDFHTWGEWSPWTMLEPGVTVNVSEDGKYYEWDGKIVGAGNMKVTAEEGYSVLRTDLTFLKPWKSFAKVDFYFKEENGGTRIHWIMDSSLPFFMFWMKKMMQAWVGMDFDRGLRMLKDKIETGKVHTHLDFEGMRQFEGCTYVGKRIVCSMDDIGPEMSKAYEIIMPYFKQNHQDLMAGHAFSIYHKWQITKGICDFTCCVPVSQVPNDLPEGFAAGKVPATKVHVVKHTGYYDHGGNAWSASMMRQSNKVFKANKRIHPMEVYLNSPKDTAAEDLQTEVWLPAK